MTEYPQDLMATTSATMMADQPDARVTLASTLNWLAAHPVEAAELLPSVTGAALRSAGDGLRIAAMDDPERSGEIHAAARLNLIADLLAGPRGTNNVVAITESGVRRTVIDLITSFNPAFDEDRRLAAGLAAARQSLQEASQPIDMTHPTGLGTQTSSRPLTPSQDVPDVDIHRFGGPKT